MITNNTIDKNSTRQHDDADDAGKDDGDDEDEKTEVEKNGDHSPNNMP